MSCGPTNFCLIYAQPPTKVKELAPLPKSNKKSGKERRPKKLRKNNNAILYHQFQTFCSFKFNLRIYMQTNNTDKSCWSPISSFYNIKLSLNNDHLSTTSSNSRKIVVLRFDYTLNSRSYVSVLILLLSPFNVYYVKNYARKTHSCSKYLKMLYVAVIFLLRLQKQ